MATKAELKARLALDTSLFQRGLAGAEAGAVGLQRSFTAISGAGITAFAKLAGVLAALGGAAGFALATKHAFDLGDRLAELSRRTGVSVSSLAILEEAFKDSGIEAEALGQTLNLMQKNLSINPKLIKGEFAGEFAAIRRLKPEEQFFAIAKMLRGIEDPAQRATLAMQIFGRAGGRLLALFRDDTVMGDAQRALGGQAGLLQANAEKFDKIADKLRHAGLVLRGFFVGVAAGVSDKLLPILNKIESIDLTGFGQKIGESLGKALDAIVGLATNMHLLGEVLAATFKGAALQLGNVLIAVFDAAVRFFRDGMIAALEAIGAMILATLIDAFRTPIAYFQAALEAALAKIPKSLGGTDEKGQAKDEIAQISQLLAATDKARDQAFAKSQAPIGSISDEDRQKARNRFTDLQDQHERLMAQRAALEPIAAGNIPTVAQRAQRILAQGGPRIGLGRIGDEEGETTDQLRTRGAGAFNTALTTLGSTIKNFAVKDVLGAGPVLEEAWAKVQQAIQDGGLIVGNALQTTGDKLENIDDTELPDADKIIKLDGALQQSIIRTGGTGFFSGLSGESLFKKKSALTRGEKEDFIKSLGIPVVQGHDALRQARKDAEKREIEKKLKAETVADKQLTLTDRIAKATEATAAAWEDK
jgi:hypothetical protein